MRHTFAADALGCPRCGGRRRVVATIEDPSSSGDSHPPRAPERGASAPVTAVRPVRLELRWARPRRLSTLTLGSVRPPVSGDWPAPGRARRRPDATGSPPGRAPRPAHNALRLLT